MTWVLLRHHTIHITDSGIILFRPTSMSGLLCLEIIPPQSSNNGCSDDRFCTCRLIYPDLSLHSKRRFMTTGSALVAIQLPPLKHRFLIHRLYRAPVLQQTQRKIFR
ncbi:uncharacterized protein LOC141648354 isoform X4 [Silene latifolia]|uniref:uncharacterized protein LOC141648354 isoform X4 n=1 Tax=Silene latifolia TaxID=37657 RepID=UPI003D777716